MKQGTMFSTYSPLLDDKHSKSVRQYRELYPSLLTLALFAIFGFAVITGVRLTQDPNARFWVGREGYSLLLIPFLLVICHIIQSYYRKPMYFPVVMSVCVPPLIAVVVGFDYAAPVDLVVNRLLSTDCTTFPQKYKIEQAYRNASSFYNDCLSAAAKNQSSTVEAVRKSIVISQCPGYNPEESDYATEWAYLQGLEETENCAGWCFDGQGALWTHNPKSWDSCASAAGMTMKSKVSRNATRLMWNGLIGFVVACTLVFLINEALRNTSGESLW